MGYRKEVHQECVKVIRKFMTRLKFDLRRYNEKSFIDPFTRDKNEFAKTVKDCCELGGASLDLSISVLLTTYTTKEAIKENKKAAKTACRQVEFLDKVQKQLYNLLNKNPSYIASYFDKHSKVDDDSLINSFMAHN